MAKNYNADQLTVLQGLEAVRKRPGMYIGGVNSAGLHHCVWEILDNSIDEAMNGHASEITLTLHKSADTVTISDNGRGIPVDKNKKTGKSGLELVLTELHAGGKFQNDGSGNYKTSGGLHGVGASWSTRSPSASSPRSSATAPSTAWSSPAASRRAKLLRKKSGGGARHRTTIEFTPDPTSSRAPSSTPRPSRPPARRQLPALGREDGLRRPDDGQALRLPPRERDQ